MNQSSRIHFFVWAIAVNAICLLVIFLCVPTVPLRAQDQESKSPGQVAFDRVCKTCHGPEARGDGAPRLTPFNREYDEVLGIVREGTGQMPPISARELSDEDVAAIVDYLKSLLK